MVAFVWQARAILKLYGCRRLYWKVVITSLAFLFSLQLIYYYYFFVFFPSFLSGFWSNMFLERSMVRIVASSMNAEVDRSVEHHMIEAFFARVTTPDFLFLHQQKSMKARVLFINNH